MQAITDEPAVAPNPPDPQSAGTVEPASPEEPLAGPPAPGIPNQHRGRTRPRKLPVIVGISAVLTVTGGLALVLANTGAHSDPTAPSALPDAIANQTFVLGGSASGTEGSHSGTPTPQNSKSATATATGPTPTLTTTESGPATPTATPGAATATTEPTDITPATTTYLAGSSGSTLAGGAVVQSCSACTGGEKVGYVGEGGTLTYDDVDANASGVYAVQIEYCDGTSGSSGRPATLTVNGVVVQTIVFTPTGGFSTPGTVTVHLALNAGSNTVEFSDGSTYTPDFNGITVDL